MQEVVESFGYWAILLGTFLEGETVLVIGGFVAHRGWLNLPLVMSAAFAGSLLGDQLYFYLGRRKGLPFLERRPRWQAKLSRVSRIVHRHQDLIILTSRFLYGLRVLIPFAVGASGVSPLRFLLLNLVGSAVWAVLFGSAGWFLGQALATLLSDLRRYETLVILSLAAAGAIAWLFRLVRDRRRGRV